MRGTQLRELFWGKSAMLPLSCEPLSLLQVREARIALTRVANTLTRDDLSRLTFHEAHVEAEVLRHSMKISVGR